MGQYHAVYSVRGFLGSMEFLDVRINEISGRRKFLVLIGSSSLSFFGLVNVDRLDSVHEDIDETVRHLLLGILHEVYTEPVCAVKYAWKTIRAGCSVWHHCCCYFHI